MRRVTGLGRRRNRSVLICNDTGLIRALVRRSLMSHCHLLICPMIINGNGRLFGSDAAMALGLLRSRFLDSKILTLICRPIQRWTISCRRGVYLQYFGICTGTTPNQSRRAAPTPPATPTRSPPAYHRESPCPAVNS